MTLKKDIVINDRAKATSQYILAFGIPFLVIILAYIGLHITPFGDKTLVISDAIALYMSDLSYIKRALMGQENLLYSFQQGIGLNLMGTQSGLLNPANVIVLLFDITDFTAMYSWLMAIDMAFCGLTMYIYLSSTYGRNYYSLIFSTVYALIGFNVAYCFHYNFLLSVELLPLIALGIRKIISGKSPWLYICTLSYTIFASFYFGYMVCIASAVLFLMWYVEARSSFAAGQKKHIWVNYVGGSLTAGLLPAFMWVASFLSFSGGRAEQNSILDFTLNENMSFADAIAKFFIGTNNINELVNGQPNVFVGALVLFLVVAFFLDKRNSTRSKVIHGLPIAFYFITFYVRALSMMMQGFTATNWFNYRYSFVFSFLMIIIAFQEFMKIREIETKDFKRSIIVFLVIVAIVFTQRYSFVSGGWMLIDLLILAGCLGAIWWNRVDEKRAPKRVLAMLLVLLCCIECYANYMVCTNQLFIWAIKEKEYQEKLLYGSIVADSINGSDSTFYRTVNEYPTHEHCNNDPRLFGYDGINYFGSCEQTFVFEGMSKLGLSWYSNRMWYAKGMPDAFDSLFGIKYVTAQRELEEEKGYEPLVAVGENIIYKNINALPIGMLTDNDIFNVTLDRDPFENHNTIWRAISGLDEEVFTQERNLSFTYHANNDGETIDYSTAQKYSTSISTMVEKDTSASGSFSESVSDNSNSESESQDMSAETIKNSGRYIECTFTAQQDGSIYSYPGAFVQDGHGINLDLMRYLGEFKKGDTVTDYIAVNTEQLTIDTMKGICAEYYVAYANDEVLSKHCQQLQSTAGELIKETDSHLIGKVNAGENCRLFFTIPYDEGWTLKVDGKEVELEKTADLFMSAEISQGEHSYELIFFPRGMSLGIKVTGGAVILLLLLIVYNVLIRKKNDKDSEQIEDVTGKQQDESMVEDKENHSMEKELSKGFDD